MPEPRDTAAEQSVSAAAALWMGAFRGVLTTHSAAYAGYPFPSLVPYCPVRQGTALLLLSHLAQHTQNLLQDPRCSLLLTERGREDPQQQSRLAVLGDCLPLEGQADATTERYFRYYPHTRPYFDELNFRFFRFRPSRMHINTGFASARWLGPARVLKDSHFSTDEEARLLAAAGDQGLLRRLFCRSTGTEAPGNSLVVAAGADPSGLDLRHERRLVRVDLPRTGQDPVQWLGRLNGIAAEP